MSHFCARDVVITNDLKSEMSVYPHILFRMGFKIYLFPGLRTVFQHRSKKFTNQVLSLSLWSYDKIIPVPLAASCGFQPHGNAVVFVMHYPFYSGKSQLECHPDASVTDEINHRDTYAPWWNPKHPSIAVRAV